MKRGILAGVFLWLVGSWSQARGQVVLSEVMYDPAGAEFHDEYVELVNLSQTETVDLRGWRLGNEQELDLLVDTGGGLSLAPGQFGLVLDGSYFGQSTTYENRREHAVFFTIEDGAFGRSGWSNTTAETVILCNAGGDTVEVFRYQPVKKPGFSWEKVDLVSGPVADTWELALVEGGTPGLPNSISGQPPFSHSEGQLQVQSNPFFRGLVFRYRVPAVPALVNLWIFDLEGYRLCELLTGVPAESRGEVEWDGGDQRGMMVPAGMYLAYLEASSAGEVIQVKKVFVFPQHRR